MVAAPPGAIGEVERALRGAVPAGAVPAGAGAAKVEVVSGGAERPDSVAAALAVLPADVDIVLVHDAARPLTPRPVVESVVAAVRAGAEGCVPVLPVCDTVKEVAGDTIVRTVDRSSLRAVQTPQGFRRTVLEKAYAELARQRPGEPVTDDSGLVERLGVPVAAVPGSDEAFKITRPLDLVLAEALLAGRAGGR